MSRVLQLEPIYSVEAPIDVPELATFACGGNSPWEQMADQMVHRIANVEILAEREGLMTARMPISFELVGLAYWVPWAINYLEGVLLDVVALQAGYRGAELHQGGRVAPRLLEQALERIDLQQEGETAPHVFAGVHPRNRRALDLFANSPFQRTKELDRAEVLMWMRWQEGWTPSVSVPGG